MPPAGYTSYNPGGGGGNLREHPRGTVILVLGIISLLVCSFVLGPIAWVMGSQAKREIDSDPTTTYTNRGNVNAGRICGMIATLLAIVEIVALIAIAASK
jgi:uncharacterized membrane protein YphA (DoxX/SURF4 family)